MPRMAEPKKQNRGNRNAIGRPKLPPGEKLVKVHGYVRPNIAAMLDGLAAELGYSTRGAFVARKLTELAPLWVLEAERARRGG